MDSEEPDPGTPLSRVRPLIIVLGIQLLLAAALLTWVAIGTPFPSFGATHPKADVPAGPLLAPVAVTNEFDGPRAFAMLRDQVELGPRPAGSPVERALADRLRTAAPGGTFEAVPGGLRNIVWTLPGVGPPVVVGAHYDTALDVPGYLGANNGAAGTAAVVELVRHFQHVQRHAGSPPLRFVLFDGEEPPDASFKNFEARALRGSRVDAQVTPKPQAMILMDYIAQATHLSMPREKNSSAELWEKLRRAAVTAGTGAIFPDTTQPPVLDDHIPYLRAGIPAIDLIDFSYPQGHTREDDLAHVSERSLDASGESVAQLLSSW